MVLERLAGRTRLKTLDLAQTLMDNDEQPLGNNDHFLRFSLDHGLDLLKTWQSIENMNLIYLHQDLTVRDVE